MSGEAADEELQTLEESLKHLTKCDHDILPGISRKSAIFLAELGDMLDNIELPSCLRENQYVLRLLQSNAKGLRERHNFKKAWLICSDLYPRQVKSLGLEHEDTRETLLEMSVFVSKLDLEGKSWENETCFGLWKARIDHKDVNLQNVIEDLLNVRFIKLHEAVYDHLSQTREESDPILMQVMLGKSLHVWWSFREDETWEIYLRVCEQRGEEPAVRPKKQCWRDTIRPSGMGIIVIDLWNKIKEEIETSEVKG